MNDTKSKPPVVGVNEMDSAIAAAKSRIQKVPASETLISSISDADWLSDDVDSWKIEAGNCLENQDELDCADPHLTNNQVA